MVQLIRSLNFVQVIATIVFFAVLLLFSNFPTEYLLQMRVALNTNNTTNIHIYIYKDKMEQELQFGKNITFFTILSMYMFLWMLLLRMKIL